jgi:membrane dipeptidase
MRFFDLHCDTITKFYQNGYDFLNGNGEVNFSKSKVFEEYKQVFAIFVNDDLRGENAWDYFLKNIDYFNSFLTNNSNFKENAIIAVEGGAVLGGDVSKIKILSDLNVRILTLTWNGENELGYGNSLDFGLKPFGFEAIKLLEENNISIDVSHLSDKGFYDVAKTAKKPFIASHSNSRKVCNNRRNLTDEQFDIIKNIKGIVGVNFHKPFVCESGNYTKNLLKHIEHFLSLGGEDVICIGSDFDGSDIDSTLNSLDKIPTFYEICCDRFGIEISNKIFYDNANIFLKGK